MFDPASIQDPQQRKAYAWIPGAEAFLRCHLKGDLADSLIKYWIEFEFHLGFPQGRPSEVDWWMKRGRDYTKLPGVPLAAKFAADWEPWYKSLQPPGPRRESKKFPLPQGELAGHADWSNLKKGGTNGIFIVLATLAFWVAGVRTQEDADRHENAVGDVLWVLRSMLASMRIEKRKPGDGDDNDGLMGRASRRTRVHK
ncbi:hypothetical protein DFH11DRAFT_1512694 [Phellopilus nigrolimitatus]|nr:hypothetical protein DFH11DRAFT_1512694 [Phellopilus nigrolimitatus]